MATKPKRTNRPFGRSLSDFPNLTPVEKRLIEFCRIGEPLIIGNGTLPEKPTTANKIRPELVRFLALGGDEAAQVHEKGLQVQGAWFDADLDLNLCNCPSSLMLINCVIKGDILLIGSQLKNLALNDSRIESLKADRVQVAGSIFLNNQFKATGEVRLLGAQIGGGLECSKGKFEPVQGDALSVDRAVINGNVFLHEGFKATGKVRFHGAQIGGTLECSNGQFDPAQGGALSADGAVIKGSVLLDDGFKATGEVRFHGAQISGDLNCRNGQFEPKEGHALSADGAVITGSVFLDDGFKATGLVHFPGAQAGGLIDDTNLIEQDIVLDGFKYDGISGGAETDALTRIAWLNKQPRDHLNENFRPQPWEHLIKVLRTMGHKQDADDVAIAKQDQLYRARKIVGINKIWHRLYGSFAGYGYRPSYTVFAMLVVWFIAAMNFQMAGDVGLMGPSSAVIQSNPDMDKICNVPDNSHETQWTTCTKLPQTYTTFSPFAYSLDLILPLVDLQQDRDWSPIVMKPDGQTIIWLGVWFRFLMWFEILFGWMASLLLVAVLGNLVKKD